MIGTGPGFDDELDRRRGERVQVRMRVNTLIRSDSLYRTGLYSLYQRSFCDIRTDIQIQKLHPSVAADETAMCPHYGSLVSSVVDRYSSE